MKELINPSDIQLVYYDLFCGAGGTSTGIHKARLNGKICAIVAACINHDHNAIRSHKSNHRQTLHFTEDITELYKTRRWDKLRSHVDYMRKLYPNAKIVLWASLECTNFSKAKGGLPRDGDSRTLAEHLFPYIELINPDYIEIENVVEFMSWGDIDAHGKPVSKDKGRSYLQWIDRVQNGYGKHVNKMNPVDYDDWYDTMRKIGSLEKIYNCDSRVLNSANFGSYTSRSRLFIKFARPELPLVWPEPTYCKGGSTGMFPFKKWKPVREVLDLEDEGKSIFNRPKPLVDATNERIYAGLIKFIAGGKDQFITRYNSGLAKDRIHSVDNPCGTITTCNRFSLIQTKFISKYYSGRPEGKVISIEGPAGTITTKDGQSIISTNFMSSYYGNGDNVSSLSSPSPTITTKDRLALVTTEFISSQYGNGFNKSLNEPCATITGNSKHSIVSCRQWLMNTNFNNVGSPLSSPSPVITANHKWHYLMNPQYKSSGSSIDKPCFTLIARMDKMPPYIMEANTEGECAHFVKIRDNVITYEIYDTDSAIIVQIKEFMSLYGIIDIKMRMLKIPELKMIMGFPSDYILIGTQAEQKKYIGNAVDVTTSTALCETTSLALYHYNQKIAV